MKFKTCCHVEWKRRLRQGEDTDEKVRHKMYPIKRTRQEGHGVELAAFLAASV